MVKPDSVEVTLQDEFALLYSPQGSILAGIKTSPSNSKPRRKRLAARRGCARFQRTLTEPMRIILKMRMMLRILSANFDTQHPYDL